MKNVYSNWFTCVMLGVFTAATNMVVAQCVDSDVDLWNDHWQSCQLSESPNPTRGSSHWILYDFGQVYPLNKTRIWNVNQIQNLDIGVRNISVDVSNNGLQWEFWGSHEVPKANGDPSYAGVVGPDLSSITAQYVLITVEENWGALNCAGLTEMKFYLGDSVSPSIGDDDGEEEEDEESDDEEEDEEIEEELDCLPPDALAAFVMNPFEALIVWEETEAEEYMLMYRTWDGDWEEVYSDEPEVYLEDLEEETVYEFAVVSICDDQDSEPSPPKSFETIPDRDDCRAPVTSNGLIVEGDVLLLAWNEVPETEEYQVRIRSVDPGASWEEIETEENFLETEWVEMETEYEYQIRALCEGEWTEWSIVFRMSNEPDSEILTGAALLAADDRNQNGLDFVIIPNPVNGEFALKLSSSKRNDIALSISDHMGRKMYWDQLSPINGNIKNLTSNGWNSGVYYVTVRDLDTGYMSIEKLVVINN